MRIQSFDRLVWGVIALLLLALAALLALGGWLGLAPPQPAAADLEVGGRGPFVLVFPQPMKPETVQARLEVRPELNGRLEWAGRTLRFWPGQPLDPSQTYTLCLQAGAQSASGNVIRRPACWDFRVRQPWVVYLSPVDAPDLWASRADGSLPKRLSDTGGKVYDFGVSVDGEWISYSQFNPQGGRDLWLIPRQGGAPRRLVECGLDHCGSPAWSPDGQKIAYSREVHGSSLAEGTNPVEIWLVDVASGQTAAFQPEAENYGVEPSWSPDGKRLAFYDQKAGSIRIVELNNRREVHLPSNAGAVGSWSPDGTKMLFNNVEYLAEEAISRMFVADLQAGTVTPVFEETLGQVNTSFPAWSPDGEWAAVGVIPLHGGASKQLWLLRLNGQEAIAITQQQNYTHAAYRWDSHGDALVFQRFQLSDSQARPEIWVWQRQTNAFIEIAKDATFPAWLP